MIRCDLTVTTIMIRESKMSSVGKTPIVIGHPLIRFAGSEARAAYCLQEFQEDYEPVLVTGGPVDIGKLNQVYVTSIDSGRVRQLYPWYHFLLERMKAGDALRGTLFGRFLRKVAGAYPLCVSVYNFMDFGKPAIQCIADFSWDEDIRKKLHPLPKGARRLFHQNKLLRKCYLSLAKSVVRPSGRNLFSGEDLILANSHWSAQVLKEKYGTDIGVLYPPVIGEFPNVPFDSKEMGFVCIGRISPEKRIERIIEILQRIRLRGHNIHLHVIGGTDETTYGKYVEDLCRAHRDWVSMEGSRFGEEKTKLLSQHRFGIHACRGEAFGISVAEMVKAGCIPFVPSEGGQAEIVNHELSMYDNVDDAVEKIDTVLQKPQLQAELRDHLEKQGMKFSTNAFMDGMRAAVNKFLSIGSSQKSY